MSRRYNLSANEISSIIMIFLHIMPILLFVYVYIHEVSKIRQYVHNSVTFGKDYCNCSLKLREYVHIDFKMIYETGASNLPKSGRIYHNVQQGLYFYPKVFLLKLLGF